MFRPDVLVARIAPGLQMASSLAKMSFLTSMRSKTASITRSTSLNASSIDSEPVIRAIRASVSSGLAVRERS